MCNMMNINLTIEDENEINEEVLRKNKIDLVLENMWKFNQTYKLSTENLVRIHALYFKSENLYFFMLYLRLTKNANQFGKLLTDEK